MSHETHTIDYEVGLLLPEVTDQNRTAIRYGGLVSELEKQVGVVLLHGHKSYLGNGLFENAQHPSDATLGSMQTRQIDGSVRVGAVRDLTMPKASTKLYEDTNAPTLVHEPHVNEFIRSKSSVYDAMPTDILPFTITRVDTHDVSEAISEVPNDMVVIKPDTGSTSKGVLVGTKSEVMSQFTEFQALGQFVIQEAIDMSLGVPEYGVQGVHNLRFIVIDGKPIFGFYREDETGSLTMAGEPSLFMNRTFRSVEEYTESIQTVLSAAQLAIESALQTSETVLAVDLIRGIGHDGEQTDYLLEINRRPLRNSPYDGLDTPTLHASHAWDVAEAEMLSRVALKR